MAARHVCVLGGSGFVGTPLCSALVRAGHRVTVLTRDPERARHLRVLPTARVVRCDVYDDEQLAGALRNHDSAINLVGILNEPGRDGSGFLKAHTELARKLVTACRRARVRRLRRK